ncbi:MAG: flagellar hook-basal body complex protein FliE [Planctomycetota bacterium]|nr:MAG: flagellar hook-basal body complex protein FliE [Planctomycetota bacterium]
MSDPVGLIGGAGGLNPIRPVGPGQADNPAGGGQAPSFRDVLMGRLNEVNALQQDATRAIEDLQTGRRDDVEGVLIATQQADAAFRMLLQVRNKMVDAYDELRQIRV